MAGVALGDIHRRFEWQACCLWDWDGSCDALGSPVTPRDAAALCVAGVALAVVSRGRRGTWPHPPSFCAAGVVLMGLGWVW